MAVFTYLFPRSNMSLVEFQQALDYILAFADFERAPRSSAIFDL